MMIPLTLQCPLLSDGDTSPSKLTLPGLVFFWQGFLSIVELA